MKTATELLINIIKEIKIYVRNLLILLFLKTLNGLNQQIILKRKLKMKLWNYKILYIMTINMKLIK